MQKITITFLISTLLTLGSTFAKSLTEEEIKKCKKIAVIAGTYDPFTNGHEAMGNEILKKLPFDCVVYLPTKNPPHKIASPFQSRYEMIQAALNDHPNLFFPDQKDLELSSRDYIEKLKVTGNKKEVFAVLGSDLSPQTKMYYINKLRMNPDGFIVTGRGEEEVPVAEAFKKKPLHVLPMENDLSSTKVRRWFSSNADIYFMDSGVPQDRLPKGMLRQSVADYIKDKGLYLGSDGVTERSAARIAKTFVNEGLQKVGLFHPLRNVLVKRNKQDALTHVTIDGQQYELKKHLGSGLTADAYIFDYEGQKHVIKIANARPRSGASIIQDVTIGTWLNKKTSIRVPEVQKMDPEGKWKITTLIGGESLGEYLSNRGGTMEPHIEKEIKNVIDDMLKLSAATNIKLDLSVDNLKIWNDKVYLIDAGPIPPDVSHPVSYEEFKSKWVSHIKPGSRQKCSTVLKTFLLKAKAN
jgi:nicotinic acid mononucleotide adenylyltransferase